MAATRAVRTARAGAEGVTPMLTFPSLRFADPAGSLALFGLLAQPSADAVVDVLPEAGRQRLGGGELEGPLPRRPQEQGRFRALPVEAVGEVELVGDEEDPDAGLQQRPHDLTPDLRSFQLVGRRERLVEQHEAARTDLVCDRAHALELFVEAPADHIRVLLADEVGEDLPGDGGP